MGMSVGQEDHGDAMSEINVTPFVDVMLVLLIIFMVTAPLLQVGVEIDLPKVDAPPLTQDPDDQLVLSIDKNLVYKINDAEFPRDDMPKKLAALASANPDQPVFIYADGEVPYKYVAELLAGCKNAGFPRLGMAMELPDGSANP